jgi:hypothetical protein
MAVKNYVYPITMTSIDSSTLTGAGYQAINGPGGLPQPCTMLKIVNNSTVLVTISWDGTTNHDVAPLGSIVIYDFQSNSQPSGDLSAAKKGTIIYVNGSAGTGLIYLVGFYNPSTPLPD